MNSLPFCKDEWNIDPVNEEIDTYKNSKILISGSRLTISRSQSTDRLSWLRINVVGWDGAIQRAAQVKRGGSMRFNAAYRRTAQANRFFAFKGTLLPQFKERATSAEQV